MKSGSPLWMWRPCGVLGSNCLALASIVFAYLFKCFLELVKSNKMEDKRHCLWMGEGPREEDTFSRKILHLYIYIKKIFFLLKRLNNEAIQKSSLIWGKTEPNFPQYVEGLGPWRVSLSRQCLWSWLVRLCDKPLEQEIPSRRREFPSTYAQALISPRCCLCRRVTWSRVWGWKDVGPAVASRHLCFFRLNPLLPGESAPEFCLPVNSGSELCRLIPWGSSTLRHVWACATELRPFGTSAEGNPGNPSFLGYKQLSSDVDVFKSSPDG